MVVERARVYLEFVGANVHRLRVKRGITQEMLEEASGLDSRFLRRVERGAVMMRLDTLIRLADALGAEPARLLKPSKPIVPKSGRPRQKTSTGRRGR